MCSAGILVFIDVNTMLHSMLYAAIDGELLMGWQIRQKEIAFGKVGDHFPPIRYGGMEHQGPHGLQ